MKHTIALLVLMLAAMAAPAQENHFAAENDVTWPALGTNENSSMPLGNGDLALNLWTEPNGDILLLLAKADAWSENGQLLKLGRVRVKLAPNPLVAAAGFKQSLKLENGAVELRAGRNWARIWVDANHPVVHLEIQAEQPVHLEARSENWRTRSYHLSPSAVAQAGFFEWGSNPDGLTFDPDVVLPAQPGQVTWCHYNSRSIYPLVFERENLAALLAKYPDPLLHRCFGMAMKGPGLAAVDAQTLKSTRAASSVRLDLYALTQTADSPAAWAAALARMIRPVEAVKIKDAWQAHQQWWTQFWDRSWIRLSGTPEAVKISHGYAQQRFMTACASRGAQPMKFNGALFTVGHDLPEGVSSSAGNHDPDYRAWGASYWNQNVRLPYWPLIATGDYDLLAPWFNLYVQALPLARDRTRAYFHHDGGAFIETIYFWGLPNLNDFGWNNPGTEPQSEWMRYHVQGGLEVVAQMLDCYDYTQDAAFAKGSLLPLADATITYYDQHWPRGGNGKILLSPAQSLETYQVNAVNPTPDIAGLMSVLPRLLALPSGLASPAQTSLWAKVQADLPPLPMGFTAKGKLPPKGQGDADGKRVILPAQKYGEPKNVENPELYAVFPYRLFGVGKPDLELARVTYRARLFHGARCWGQDGTQSATLGLTGEAKEIVLQEFTDYGDQQFPWFWAKSNDWIPDMDNGGAGMMTLQLMLLQCDGQRIQLLPAWPADWTVDFKLHAPGQTTVAGRVEHGKVRKLKVMPAARRKDVVTVAGLSND